MGDSNLIDAMSQLTEYGLKDASDAEDNESWFWGVLLDLHGKAKNLIAEHTARLVKLRLERDAVP